MGYRAEDFPESEWVFERVISLPIYPGMTDEVEYVIGNVLDIARRYRR
jgi:perosamine synthetase